MPVDEVQFGELIGTVRSLAVTVADMKAAVLPAIENQSREMARYRDDCRASMDEHKKDDAKNHETLETLCAPIADLQDIVYGDGTQEDLGLKKTVNKLVLDQVKYKARSAGVAACVGGLITVAGIVVHALHG